MIEIRRKRNEILFKENDELLKILASQEQEHKEMNELFNKFNVNETNFKKLQEENKLLVDKRDRLITEEADKNSRVQEYRTRQEEAKVEYEKVKGIVETQAYSKTGIAKILSDIMVVEDTIRRLQKLVKNEDNQVIEKKQEKRELEGAINKTLKKLNTETVKVYGSESLQLKFDPDKTSLEEMLTTTNGLSLETLEQSQGLLYKQKQEELSNQGVSNNKLKEEIRQRSKEIEELKKSNELVKTDIANKRTKLKEMTQIDNDTESSYKNKLENGEGILRNEEKTLTELTNEVFVLDENCKKKKNYLDALIEQRKKDREEIRNIIYEFVNEIYEYKIEMEDDFDQLTTVIHNVNIQLQQSEPITHKD